MLNKKDETNVKNIAKNVNNQMEPSRQGVLIDYNPYNNTAIVALSSQNGDNIGEIIENVPCPHTPGIQTHAPEPGKLCWVTFRNGNMRQPVITHFYSNDFRRFDYRRHYWANTGISDYFYH